MHLLGRRYRVRLDEVANRPICMGYPICRTLVKPEQPRKLSPMLLVEDFVRAAVRAAIRVAHLACASAEPMVSMSHPFSSSRWVRRLRAIVPMSAGVLGSLVGATEP